MLHVGSVIVDLNLTLRALSGYTGFLLISYPDLTLSLENVRSGKVRFRACSVPARPEIRAFLSLRMFVLSVVI